MNPKPFSRWKLAGIILGALVFSAAILVLYLWKAAQRRYDRMQQSVLEVTEPLRSRSPMRPVLHGKPLPGDATEVYSAAENESLVTGFHQKLRWGLETLSPSDLKALNEAHRDLERLAGVLGRGASRESASIINDKYQEIPLSLSALVVLSEIASRG